MIDDNKEITDSVEEMVDNDKRRCFGSIKEYSPKHVICVHCRDNIACGEDIKEYYKNKEQLFKHHKFNTPGIFKHLKKEDTHELENISNTNI